MWELLDISWELSGSHLGACGSFPGIHGSLQALKNKKVCILEPAWLGYKAAAILANYDTEPISLNELDWLSKLEKSSFDTLIICSPNNPNGKIFTEEETKNITKIAKKNDAWIIADLIYERYSYNLNKYNIFLSNISKYFKLIIANGFSKSHAMTGFRIGYLLIKDDSIKNRILLLQQNIATCPSVIAQQLLINFNNADKEIKYFYKYYLKNRGLVLNIFPEWENQIPEGGFYYFINLNKYGVRNANIFCKKLLINTGVALVPGEAYGDGFDSFVRISFSNDTQKLKIALSLLREFLNKWV